MKHKFFTLILITGLIDDTAFTQPLIRSQKVFGGKLSDYFTCMALTKDGGYILGGWSDSNKSGNKTEHSRGSYDYWVIKLDSTGKIQWDKTIGGSAGDFLRSIQQTTDGGYILGGYSGSRKSGEKSENSRGGADYWIVKLNSNGNIQWDKTFGGSDGDFLLSLQQTTDGGYILGGHSYSNKSGEKTENSRGLSDYWVVKLNSNGNIQWDKTLGGSNDDWLYALQQTSDDGYIVGGSSSSNKSGEKTENSRGLFDYWVVKLNGLGNIQWDKTIGGSDFDESYTLQQTSDDGYILGGYSDSNKSGEKTENNRGGDDYWLVKLNGSGNIQWDKTIGGNEQDDLGSLQQTVDGGYILAGWSWSGKSGEKTENTRGGYDYWVVKLNSNGNIRWDKTIGGSANDEDVTNIKERDKDRYVVVGSSYSEISGDKKKRSRGLNDYWLVALDDRENNTIATIQNSNNPVTSKIANNKSFIVYPNPANDVLHVQITSRATVSLINQSGKILLTKIINGSGIINVTNLKPGLYFLKNATTGAVQKVIVSR